jgi:hypothetical protein
MMNKELKHEINEELTLLIAADALIPDVQPV